MADREPEAEPDAASPERGGAEGEATPREEEPDSLREAVEARYDFDSFGPADMAAMTVEEWEAVFDPDAWLTGPDLVDRVEAELRSRVASRQVFAVVERHEVDGEPRLLAYDDGSWAVVHPDGTVEGDGAVRRDVEPAVALCSMPDYEVPSPPPDAGLPDPATIQAGGGSLGHRLLLVLGGVLGLAGLVVLFAPLVLSLGPGAGALTTVVGLGFLGAAVVLAVLVANARLSDRFRAAAYRERLLAMGLGDGERPAFLPPMDGAVATGGDDASAGDDGSGPASPPTDTESS